MDRKTRKIEKPIEDESFIGCKLIADFMCIDTTKICMGKYFWLVIGDENDAFDYENRVYYKPDKTMDFLYPVFQSISKFIISDKYRELCGIDIISSFKLSEQFKEISYSLVNGEQINEIFKEIVEWIRVYNLIVKI